MKTKKTYIIIVFFAIVLSTFLCCEKEEPIVKEDKIVFSSDPSLTFDENGGSATLTFTATNDWKIGFMNQTIGWCSFSPKTGHSGINNVTVDVIGNNTYDERNAGLKISCGNASEQVLVTQKQMDALLLTSNKVEIGAEGGTASVSLKTNTDFRTEVDSESSSWIKISGTKGLVEKTVTLEISENGNVEGRTGKVIFISGDIREEVDVFQSGAEPQFILTTREFNVGSEGGDITVEFATNSEYSYVVSDRSWIKETGSPQSLSSYKLNFRIEGNDTYDSRKGNIIFTNEANQKKDTVFIYQNQQNAISVDNDKIGIGSEGGPVTIKVSSNIDYTYSIRESDSWIRRNDNPEPKELQDSYIELLVDENDNAETRTGYITITSGDCSKEVTIIQKGVTVFEIGNHEYNVGSDGDYIKIDITSNVGFTYEVSDNSWIKEVTQPLGTSLSELSFKIEPNSAYMSRRGHIVFTNEFDYSVDTVYVNQYQKDALIVDQDSIVTESGGGQISIDVSSNIDYEYSIDEGDDWIHPAGTPAAEGLTDTRINLIVDKYDAMEDRVGRITVSSGKYSQEVKIIQRGKPQLKIGCHEYNVGSDGGNIEIEITANVEYSYEISDNSWIKKAASSSFKIEKNESYVSRRGYIVFINEADKSKDTVYVNQAQKDALIVGIDSVEVESDGGPLTIKISSNVDYTYTIGENDDWIHPSGNPLSDGLKDSNIYLNIDKNDNPESRTGSITVISDDSSARVVITQKGITVFKIENHEYNVGSEGEDIEVNITANVDYSYEISDEWIKESSSPKGVSESALHFRIERNEGYTSRSGKIVFTNLFDKTQETVLINQYQKDALIVDQDSVKVESAGGTVIINVSSNVDYEYSLGETDDWIHIAPSIASESLEDSSIHLEVDVNEGPASRTGCLTVTSGDFVKEVTIVQEGDPVFIIEDHEYNVGSEGDDIEISVTANVDYSYEILESWIKEAPSVKSVSGSKLNFVIEKNDGYASRKGHIVFTNEFDNTCDTVIVNQYQKDALIIENDDIEVGSEGGPVNIKVSSNVDYEYSIRDVDTWIHIAPAPLSEEGLEDSVIKLEIDENEEPGSRTGYVTVTSGKHSVKVKITQKGNSEMLIENLEYNVGSEGDNIEINITANVEYSYEITESWIKEAMSPTAVSGSKLNFEIEKNETYKSRIGYIIFTNEFDKTKVTVTVNQAQKDAIIVDKDVHQVENTGGNVTIKVSSNMEYEYSVGAADDWIHPAGSVKTDGLKDSKIDLIIDKNENPESRTGHVTITAGIYSKEVTIIQKGMSTMIVSELEYNVQSKGETIEVVVTSNSKFTYEISDEWIKESASPTSVTKTKLHFKIEANKTFETRQGTIVFTNEDDKSTETVVINQNQKPGLFVNSNNIKVAAEGGNVSIEIKTNMPYSYNIPKSCDWIHESASPSSEGLEDHIINLLVDPNPGSAKRDVDIAVTAGPRYEMVTIEQEGYKFIPVLEVSENKIFVESSATDITFKVKSNVPYDINIGKSWITKNASMSEDGVSEKTYSFHVKENTGAARTANITIEASSYSLKEVVEVEQEAKVVVEGEINLTLGHNESTLKSPEWTGGSVNGTVHWGDGAVESYYSGISHKFGSTSKKDTEFDMHDVDTFKIPALKSVSSITIEFNE